MQDVKPTRMELLKLQEKLKTSKRGHKLLKEKRDGLMKKFMEVIKESKKKKNEVEEMLSAAGKHFTLATSSLLEEEVRQFFSWPSSKIEVSVEKDNIMGVEVPKFEANVEGDFKTYSHSSFPLGAENSLEKYWEALNTMLGLASIEHTARLLSYEIEKVRRRVNALEYIIIPRVESQIKYISAKLDEQERSEKIIRMKIKDMITE